MSAYETSFNISKFAGLNQTGDGYNMNMAYAREMENVNISGGSFQPMREGRRLEQTLHEPISTLAYLHRRWGQTPGTLLVAISNGRVFTKTLDGSDEWQQKYPPLVNTADEGEEPVWEEDGDPLDVSVCDWVTYEINERNGEPTEEPVDILLFSNATDGMYCLYGDSLEVVPVETPKKFGVLARYNERIWGAGITDDPDMLVYSVPYDPFDWSANYEIPEDGAGDIQQPTWDGDGFVSLKQYGNTLLAIKRNSIWRISGTNPGEFSMQQQYGGGTIAENTIAIYNEYGYMLGEYGLMQYNGSGAFPFQQEALHLLMREQLSRVYDVPEYSNMRSYYLGEMCMHEGKPYRCTTAIYTEAQNDRTIEGEEWTAAHWAEVTGTPMDKVCAGMWDGVYCLAIPTNNSWYCNTILQYDTVNRTFSLRTGVSVSSFLQINERLFYTSATYPGAVFELNDTRGRVLPVKWVSGYQDLGVKSSIKSAFIAYLMVDSPAPVELCLGVRTEKKLKQKRITTKPGKVTRTHLNCQGREFRLEIESHGGIPYSISGGIKVDLELDPD